MLVSFDDTEEVVKKVKSFVIIVRFSSMDINTWRFKQKDDRMHTKIHWHSLQIGRTSRYGQIGYQAINNCI
jgi:hypothetical protein